MTQRGVVSNRFIDVASTRHRAIHLSDDQPKPDADNDEFVDAVAEEMTRLIEFYHPKLVEEVGSE